MRPDRARSRFIFTLRVILVFVPFVATTSSLEGYVVKACHHVAALDKLLIADPATIWLHKGWYV